MTLSCWHLKNMSSAISVKAYRNRQRSIRWILHSTTSETLDISFAVAAFFRRSPLSWGCRSCPNYSHAYGMHVDVKPEHGSITFRNIWGFIWGFWKQESGNSLKFNLLPPSKGVQDEDTIMLFNGWWLSMVIYDYIEIQVFSKLTIIG